MRRGGVCAHVCMGTNERVCVCACAPHSPYPTLPLLSSGLVASLLPSVLTNVRVV